MTKMQFLFKPFLKPHALINHKKSNVDLEICISIYFLANICSIEEFGVIRFYFVTCFVVCIEVFFNISTLIFADLFVNSEMASDLNSGLSKKTVLGLKAWVLMGIIVGLFIIIILVVLSVCLTLRKKSRRHSGSMLPLGHILSISEDIKEISVDQVSSNSHPRNGGFMSLNDKFSEGDSGKVLIQTKNGDNSSQSGSFNCLEKDLNGSQSGEDSGGFRSVSVYRSSSHPISAPSPCSGLPEFSHLGWGHWFTLRDLELATNRFSKDSIIGEGGYGIVYRGQLINGNPVAVKKLLNNL